jgi:flagellin-like protein
MRRITKLKKSIKGISPIIATLLLIAIAVVASLVVYLWVMGYLSAKTSTAGDSIMIPSFTSTNGYLTVYVQNTGQGIVHLDPSGSFYVNSTAAQITQENGTTPATMNFPITLGKTISFVTSSKANPNDEVTIKAVTTEGTFIQVSGTVQGAAAANYFTVSSTSGTQVAGTDFSVTVTATYPSGSPDTTYTGTVHFTSTDPQAVLPADYTFTAADAGVHAFTVPNGVTLGTAGTQSVTVTDTSTKITGSETVSVSHGAAASVSVSPSTDTVTAGATVPYTATAKDAYGNTWDATSTAGWSGGGAWTGATLTTQAAGTFTITATLPTASGTAQLTVNPGSAYSFKVSGFPSPVTAGATGNSVTVTAEDQEGNVATGYTGTVQITSSDTKAVLPANAKLTDGVGTFAVTLKTAGTQSITATDTVTSSITGSQTGIVVNPGSAVTYAFSSISTPQTAGLPFAVTITAQDAYGNAATTYYGTADLTDLNGPISPATATFAAGVWTGSVNITKATAEDALIATDSVTSSIAGESGLFTVNPGPLATFTFGSISSPQTAGSAFSVTITAVDAYGNTEAGSTAGYTVPGYTGTATLADTSGSISPTSATFTAGVWTGSVTITKATTGDVITATDPTTKMTGSSLPFTVTSLATASSFSFSTISSPQIAGAGFTVTISAVDIYGNTVPGYTGAATLTDTSGTIYTTAPGITTTSTFVNGVWTGSVTVTKATASDVITATDAVNNLKGSSGSFAVGPGALASFTFGSIGSTQTAGTAFPVTVTAYDQYLNVETSYPGTAAFSDQTGTLAISGSWSAGVWTGTMTVTKASTTLDYITATDSTSTPVVIGTSTDFTVNPGPLASFIISPIGTLQHDTVAFSVTTTAYDQYGNVATGYTATSATLSDLTGTITPTSAPFTAGVSTVSVNITSPYQNDVITVTAASGIYAKSNSFNVVAGSLDHFVFGAISSPQTAGTAFSITITAEDANGHTVTTYVGSAAFTDLSGSIQQTGTGTFTAGVWNGLVTITKVWTGDVITATDLTSGMTGKSNAFNVTSGGSTDPATKLVYIAGTGQSITIYQISSVFTIQLQDKYGNPVNAGTGGDTVTLTSSSGTGIFYNSAGAKATSITILSGQSTASFYYNDTTSGTPTLTATYGTLSAQTSIAVNEYMLVFSTGAGQKLPTGQESSVIYVTVETYNGGTVRTHGITITVTLNSTSSTGKFYNSAGTQITTINISGSGTYYGNSDRIYYSDTTAGTPTLSATANGYTTATTQFTIYTPTLSGFTFNTISSPQETGQAFSITITAVDQNGNTMTSFTGTATLSSSTGTISPTTATFTASDAGVCTVSVTITATLTTPTSTTITATSGSATGTSTPAFTLYTPTLSSFSFSNIYGTKTAGTTFSVTITAEDQEGRTLTSFEGTATLTETGSGAGGTVNPSTVTFTNGVYTGTNNVYVTMAGSSVTITATSGTATGVSGAFTVNMGAPVSITVSPATDSVTAGSSVTYTATGTDAYGNTGSVTSSVTWSITTGAGGSWSYRNPNVYTSQTAGTWTVTATEAGVSGKASLTVTPGTLSQFVLSQNIGTQHSGVAFSLTITAEDAYGNTVTSYQGTLTLSAAIGTVSPTSVTFVNGVYTSSSVSITVSSGTHHGEYLYVTYQGTQYTTNTFTISNP